MKTLAITVGDINGIGPEVSLKAAFGHRWPQDLRLVLVGHAGVVARQARRMGFRRPPLWDPVSGPWPAPRVSLWDPFPRVPAAWEPGAIRAQAAELAIDWVHAAVRQCLEGRLDGVVTAPLCKEGLRKAGLDIPGHTEFIARLAHAERFAMMLWGGPLRVIPVTRHVPLRQVAEALTPQAVRDAIRIAVEALPWLGCPGGRVGVAGLNPHAGEGGTLGTEERDVIAPAVRAAQRRGWPVEGPVPADVIFHRALRGDFAIVVSMYHDQGLAPLKMIAFERGVNVTLGLPIVRTSPDHGTAFDIAGKNRANPQSMIAAIACANRLARRKNPWR